MSKKFWDLAGTVESVETSGGGKVAQDYFGMYSKTNAENAPVTAQASGRQAQTLADETERKRLNIGKMFHGFITRRRVGPVFLYIANHPIYGPCAYVDQKTSRPPTEIEILANGAKDRLTIETNSFFDNLPNEPMNEKSIQQLCDSYENMHIRMIRN